MAHRSPHHTMPHGPPLQAKLSLAASQLRRMAASGICSRKTVANQSPDAAIF